jgi:hypothetical protein
MKKKKGTGSKEGGGATPTTSTAEKTAAEKTVVERVIDKLQTPAEKGEQVGKLDKEMEERLDKAFEKNAGKLDKEFEARLREAFERVIMEQNLR